MPASKLTDEEVLATFMEPKPTFSDDPGIVSEDGWWWMGTGGWEPLSDSLDDCHNVEARLTDTQWAKYERQFFRGCQVVTETCERCGKKTIRRRPISMRRILHADAPTKIAALAQVLRAVVEDKHAGK
jgi:hypothetical protein